jgi:hypothetical protein
LGIPLELGDGVAIVSEKNNDIFLPDRSALWFSLLLFTSANALTAVLQTYNGVFWVCLAFLGYSYLPPFQTL